MHANVLVCISSNSFEWRMSVSSRQTTKLNKEGKAKRPKWHQSKEKKITRSLSISNIQRTSHRFVHSCIRSFVRSSLLLKQIHILYVLVPLSRAHSYSSVYLFVRIKCVSRFLFLLRLSVVCYTQFFLFHSSKL